ncbi:MAG: peptide-methionine (S)-S-oxide reductase MsrA [Methanobacteriota archaeon]
MGDATTNQAVTLGGGCFWCLQPIFQELRGVTKVEVGYAGGTVVNPSYENVCTDTTGHAEVVQVAFDPGEITTEDLLRVFFTVHDPTTPNRQGHDVGTQYRSVVLYTTPEQKTTTMQVIEEVTKERLWDDPIVTEVGPLTRFYRAEAYHQDYFRKNPWAGYCRAVVAPKVAKFRKTFADRLKKETATPKGT